MNKFFKTVISTTMAVMTAAAVASCGSNSVPSERTSAKAGNPDKKAILVVSFGTSYNDTREATIGAIENKIAEDYPEYDVKRAFTSQTIIKKLKERDGLEIDNVQEAMERLVSEGYGTVIVQPTHVMNGIEYEEMKAATAPYEDKFSLIKYGTPLLTTTEDYSQLIEALAAQTPETDDKTAVVFMGHGTEHYANSAYGALDCMLKNKDYENYFIGTVEGYPDLDAVMTAVKKTDAEKVLLQPLMIVAGDHATNDMAGDEEDSWKTAFKAEGYSVDCLLQGLGENEKIQQMFADHVGEAINAE